MVSNWVSDFRDFCVLCFQSQSSLTFNLLYVAGVVPCGGREKSSRTST